MTTTNVLPAASGKGRLITLWTLSGIVALAFVFVGSGKLAGTAAMVELFDRVGLGQWFRYLTGLLEVGGGIGLLIPRYALPEIRLHGASAVQGLRQGATPFSSCATTWSVTI